MLIQFSAVGWVSATLTLLVSRIVTDDHDFAVATNHLAGVTDLLNTRLYLHGFTSAGLNRLSVWLLVTVDDAAAG